MLGSNFWGVLKLNGVHALWESKDPLWRTRYFNIFLFRFSILKSKESRITWAANFTFWALSIILHFSPLGSRCKCSVVIMTLSNQFLLRLVYTVHMNKKWNSNVIKFAILSWFVFSSPLAGKIQHFSKVNYLILIKLGVELNVATVATFNT